MAKKVAKLKALNHGEVCGPMHFRCIVLLHDQTRTGEHDSPLVVSLQRTEKVVEQHKVLYCLYLHSYSIASLLQT